MECAKVRTRIAVRRVFLLAAIGLAFLSSSTTGQDARHVVRGGAAFARQGNDTEGEVALAGILGAPNAATAPAIFTGRVLMPDGRPAADAVVVTSAGGKAVAAADGSFEIEVQVALDAHSVQVTAVTGGGSGTAARSLVASARVEPLAPGRTVPVGRLVLAQATSCQPSWLPTFGGMPGVDGSVFALTVFDDGNGPALYAGGVFTVSPAGDSFLAKWGCAAIESFPGCTGNPATLAALTSSAPLGVPLPLRITGSAASAGVGQVYFGAPGFDASGCGLLLPGLGKLLISLVPQPYLMARGSLVAGTCTLSFVVPANPAYVGLLVHLQGFAVDIALPQPLELANALALKLGP
jgi:hypothetical protein